MDEKELQPMTDDGQVGPVEPLQNYETDYTEELDLGDINDGVEKYNSSLQGNSEEPIYDQTSEYTKTPDEYNQDSIYTQSVDEIVQEPNMSSNETPDYNNYSESNTTNFFEGLTNDEVVSTPVEPVIKEEKVELEIIKPIENNVNEHPDAKIKLNFNQTEESEEEEIKLSDIKLDIRGNKNLKYVIGLGLLILVFIVLLPLFA